MRGSTPFPIRRFVKSCWRSPSGTTRISDAAAHESPTQRRKRIPCPQRETLMTGNSLLRGKGLGASGRRDACTEHAHCADQAVDQIALLERRGSRRDAQRSGLLDAAPLDLGAVDDLDGLL